MTENAEQNASAFLGSRPGWFHLPQDTGVSQQVPRGWGEGWSCWGLQCARGFPDCPSWPGVGFSGRRENFWSAGEDCVTRSGRTAITISCGGRTLDKPLLSLKGEFTGAPPQRKSGQICRWWAELCQVPPVALPCSPLAGRHDLSCASRDTHPRDILLPPRVAGLGCPRGPQGDKHVASLHQGKDAAGPLTPRLGLPTSLCS